MSFNSSDLRSHPISQMRELESESNKDIHGIRGDENESDKKTETCFNCGFELPLQPRKKCSAPVVRKKTTGQGFATPEIKEERTRQAREQRKP